MLESVTSDFPDAGVLRILKMFCFLSRVVSPRGDPKCVYKAGLSPRPSRARRAAPVSGGEDGCSWVGAGPVELFSMVVGAGVR